MSTSPNTHTTPRHGIALPIALAAIIVVGALIAGVFFASTQEYRVGRNTLGAQRALHGAEVGLSSVVSSWSPARTRLKVGFTDSLADTIIDEAYVKRRWTKVNGTTFWVTSTAIAGSQSIQARALKRLNAIIRIETPDFKIMGAITSRGPTSGAGNTTISGNDTIPTGWDCPPSGAPAAGIVVNDSATSPPSGAGGCSGWACITGNPKIKDSTALVKDTMTFTRFGGFSYDSLAALASKVRSGGGTFGTIGPVPRADGSCDIGHIDNWGGLNHPGLCDDFLPIVHLRGPTVLYKLDGGAGGAGGQGILLVDGNLHLAGKFRWTGLIIVRGTLTITGSANDGPKVTGAIAAMNRAAGTNTISGGSNVTFSRCVLNEISSRFSTAYLLPRRSWADLSF